MCEVIDRKTFAGLAATGGIRLSEDEAEDLRREINHQMCIIRQLEVIPLEDHALPVVHGNPYPEAIRCELRKDILLPFENIDKIIDQVPAVRDRYIVSPDIPHQKIG